MSPGLHDTLPESVSPSIELEPLLSPNNNSKNLKQPSDSACQSSTTFASFLEGTKSVAVSSMTLRRSLYIPAFVLGYTALAVFAWAVTCILSYRPITTGHYGVSNNDDTYLSLNMHSLFVKNEQWFSAARFIQSVVTVLTIPLTSAVCSKAAVVFVQRKSGLSLRQAMTLADKGWTEPKLYVKLLVGGLKRYGSSFLFLAILLNILGGIISPLQSLFLTSRTIKTPTWPRTVSSLTDMLDPSPDRDADLIPVLVRSVITSTSNADLQSDLWTSSPINCNTSTNKNDDPDPPKLCTLPGVTLANMSLLPNPFLAQLPSGYSTGLIRQFLPRINSSATREVITEADFPANCDTLPGSFYVNYANSGEFGNWSLIACMPADQTLSPWKQVRTRQDFSEELYLNLSVAGFGFGVEKPDKAQGNLFKISVNTTAGFFELPNYMNQLSPGPLLDDDPSNHCGLDCMPQGDYLNPISDHNLTSRSSLTGRDNTNGTNIISNSSISLELLSPNRGPLLTIAIALFGDGSFIADRVTHPEAYINDTTNGACIGQAPLIGLLHGFSDQSQDGNILDPCIRTVIQDDSLQQQIATYVSLLYYNERDIWESYDGERIKNAFESAGFLANQAWLQSQSSTHTFTVQYDAGADTVVPAISRAGIIFISVLLALDLFSLLAMALYSSWTPCWTDQLDAFAMMRIGAAIAESLPFRVADTTDRIKVLDETPGWIGDVTEGKGNVGELGIGAPTPLRGRRKYACY